MTPQKKKLTKKLESEKKKERERRRDFNFELATCEKHDCIFRLCCSIFIFIFHRLKQIYIFNTDKHRIDVQHAG